MKPAFLNSELVFLHPGEVIFCNKPIVIATVLGSCVAITFYNGRTGYTGISHCQLPQCKDPRQTCNGECEGPYKYVDCTIKKMINKFLNMEIKKNEIDVKIFGGGDVLNYRDHAGISKTVGKLNIDMAVNMVEKNYLNLTAMDVGGKTGRKIFFLTNSGEVYLSRLKYYEEN